MCSKIEQNTNGMFPNLLRFVKAKCLMQVCLSGTKYSVKDIGTGETLPLTEPKKKKNK